LPTPSAELTTDNEYVSEFRSVYCSDNHLARRIVARRVCGFNYQEKTAPIRQAIDFAEIEGDLVDMRKWANEVERSGHELGKIVSCQPK